MNTSGLIGSGGQNPNLQRPAQKLGFESLRASTSERAPPSAPRSTALRPLGSGPSVRDLPRGQAKQRIPFIPDPGHGHGW